ncbi:exodeoxyribonuclease VII large subunit [Chitinophaga sp. sic0106]|uniref:exodeoxyribonuclease VII large subunit n=1 Tax=Chitinophaga sp. sic0106 TaxID=2854785 RepID=UPI001C45CCC9|nr:exodeoxyribonuclease VII large subunit [Chitinophaga sp. sic0106]MBV7529566.1 exodeoxyribonuclease VII large subunit [Chitinophaga sp. sic0106]
MSHPNAIRLSELSARIRAVVQQAFAGQSYWVKADITSHSFYPDKGIHYFDLVEKDERSGIVARVAANAWGNGSKQIKAFELITGQPFRNNIHVLVQVTVSYHQVHGLQVTVQDVDISFTIGQLEQQKQLTLARLLAENADAVRLVDDRYITRNQELPLPAVIQQIAVVTSGNSAGYQDFHHTLVNNGFGYTFTLDTYFTVVQGEANAELVQQRMLDVFNAGKAYDAVVIIRGGGAQTDFLLFDSYQLGRVVARFPIPVITGIGHQKNETVTDMMAHTAVKTPTKAAELIIAHNRGYEEELLQFRQRILVRAQQAVAIGNRQMYHLQQDIINKARSVIGVGREELLHMQHGIGLGAKQLLRQQQQQVQYMQASLQARPLTRLQREQEKLWQQAQFFKMLAPESMLRRGFALVYKDGQLLKDATDIIAGNHITIQLQDAAIQAVVQSKSNTDERGTDI